MDNKKNFSLPHRVFEPQWNLDKTSRIVLVALLALQDKFILRKTSDRESFNISNKDLCLMIGISHKTLLKCRKTLKERKWIEFTSGYKGHNSDYTILLDNFISK